ncbi:MAG: DedA family protein [Sphingomonas bacterium]|nr:DedA family protein [Sphingomonas bacterium]
MSIEALVAQYGLPALFIGAGLEGEAAVVAGGLLAHRGLVPIGGAMAAVSLGSFVADQLWFQVGRRFRDARLVKKARAQPAYARAMRLLERYPIGFIFAFRFIYGLRTVSPIAIGTSNVSGRTYLAVNAAAAVIWGCCFTLAGYVFGKSIEEFFGRFGPHGHQWLYLAAAIVIVGAAAGLFHWRRRKAA